MTVPEPTNDSSDEPQSQSEAPPEFVPLPSNSGNSFHPSHRTTLSPLVCDKRALSRLLEQVIYRSGKTISGVAKDLGSSPNNISQYLNGRRQPGMLLFLKICEICGSKVKIELPERGL